VVGGEGLDLGVEAAGEAVLLALQVVAGLEVEPEAVGEAEVW